MPTPAPPLRIFVALVFGLAALVVAGPTPEATAATRSCSASTPLDQRPTLVKGDRGTCVQVLQNLLVAQGYSPKTNGSFDDVTDVAVRRFQHDHVGLLIDGRVTAPTWGALVSEGTPYIIQSGPNRSDYVVLSFDDCPPSREAFQEAVLGAKGLGIALALFPTGQCLDAGRFDATFARAHGHYVFNHSVTHARLTELSAKNAYAELGAPGVQANFGRPPFGAYNTPTVRDAYAKRGMRIWTWNVDTRDWEPDVAGNDKTTEDVVRYAVANAKAGDTVLMHMQWNAFNTPALTQIQVGLRDRGLEVCRNQNKPTDSRPTLNC